MIALMGRRNRYHYRRGEEPNGFSRVQHLVARGLALWLIGLGAIVVSHREHAVERTRAPQIGDVWHGCDDARAAGAAPIYRGEPGYSADMDGDGDGIACEPIAR
jgi:hypothetical protein